MNILRISLIVTLSCLFSVTGFSQKKHQQNQVAHDHITAIKSSALLIRLKTKQKTIDAMRVRGLTERADNLEAETQAKNKEIISGFATDFNFCPVYFYLSSDSQFVLDNELDSVHFVNDQLVYDPVIKFSGDIFYLAEFGNIEQRPSSSKSGEYDTYDADGKLITREAYQGQTDFGFGALVIQDANFNQLDKPFPYYERTFQDLPFVKRKPSVVIRKMNTQLFSFLSSN